MTEKKTATVCVWVRAKFSDDGKNANICLWFAHLLWRIASETFQSRPRNWPNSKIHYYLINNTYSAIQKDLFFGDFSFIYF